MDLSRASDPEVWQPFFRKANVSIIGLGLIGGSLALDLRPYVFSITAFDLDENSRAYALRRGWVDAAYGALNETICQSDLIILATPVCSILKILKELGQNWACKAVVMDVGSTKQAIIQEMDNLPAGFDPLGGHPMSGKDKGKLINAEKGLFMNAPFALIPLQRTTEAACQAGLGLCDLIKARPVWLDATRHDQHVAAISHLPYLMAQALTLSVSSNAFKLAGPGFRSSSRLAGCEPSMMIDILMTNRPAILQSLDAFQLELNLLKTLLDKGDEVTILQMLEEGKKYLDLNSKPALQ